MSTMKTYRFDADVLDVLMNKTHWSEDGLSCTMDQLDRKLYVKVAKALEIMGGRWITKVKATVFDVDPRKQIEGFLQAGGVIEVVNDGFYETPLELVDLMFERAAPMDLQIMLEPSAGKGRIAFRALDRFVGVSVDCVEINKDRCEYLQAEQGNRIQRHVSVLTGIIKADFMEWTGNIPGPCYTRIIMNPPFEANQDIRHVMRAFERFLAPGGVMVAIVGAGALAPYWERTLSGFYHDEPSWEKGNGNGIRNKFADWLIENGAVVYANPPKSFHESGTDVNTGMIVLRKPINDIEAAAIGIEIQQPALF